MADVSQDASGRASPKPGDISAQQASRSGSPDRGKLRVFISYSRDDLDFADQLNAALDACGFECFIDRQGISGGEDWKRRLGNLISEADTRWFSCSRRPRRGDASSMTYVGSFYLDGYPGVVGQDYAKAREWFERAANKGDKYAMSRLGRLYDNGYGVAKDYAKAREWYEKAADKGDSDAMIKLGLLYDNGHGVAQDYAKAREWFEKAADTGDSTAKAKLEELAIRKAAGTGRYAEALQLQEALAAKVEAGEETAQALGGVAWYALFARQFTKALTVADRAHALLPDNLPIETNRAHALMFLGRKEESKALYLAHKGKPLSEGGKLWEHVIADDFAEFRRAGLTHTMMADIERALGVSR